MTQMWSWFSEEEHCYFVQSRKLLHVDEAGGYSLVFKDLI